MFARGLAYETNEAHNVRRAFHAGRHAFLTLEDNLHAPLPRAAPCFWNDTRVKCFRVHADVAAVGPTLAGFQTVILPDSLPLVRMDRAHKPGKMTAWKPGLWVAAAATLAWGVQVGRRDGRLVERGAGRAYASRAKSRASQTAALLPEKQK